MLSINRFSVQIDGKNVINNLTLQVKPGKTHVLMGPNGAGKSSLAQALMGHPQYQISKGSQLTLNQLDLIPLNTTERAQAGLFLAFQSPVSVEGVSVQNFLKTAYEAVHCSECGSHSHCPKLSVSEFRQDLAAKAQSLKMPVEFLKRSVNDGFSGGEKKRLEILQLLVLKPKIAILDEPDSGLDLDSLKVVATGINGAATVNGTGVLLITHYPRLLDHLKPDTISIVVSGQLVKTGGLSLVKQIETRGYQSFC